MIQHVNPTSGVEEAVMDTPYIVTIPEIWERTLIVNAETEEQARLLAEDYYMNHVIGEADVLDAPEYLSLAITDPEEMDLVEVMPATRWKVRRADEYDPDA